MKRFQLVTNINTPPAKKCACWLLLATLFYINAAQGDTATKSFAVTATISKGCAFGSSLNSPISDLGTINFGSMSSIPSNLDVASTTGAGSVVITCTPGITVAIAMDYGTHGGNATQRYMANSTNTGTLAYQLYQDAGRTQVWGTGLQAKTISNFPTTTQTYPVYARLFSATTLPTAGTYTDIVTVTLTY
ncbi:Csu type fimbrial protein [Rouxiella sp. Mn2063]|uniref:Csu type fimbrial protein n=1 Tax=Rouxiella sp. Mn2063 TaxID=3395262 RepID=UPI003BE87045